MSMTLTQWLDLLQSADAAIDRENAPLLAQATDDIKQYIQSIMHERTGHMIEATYALGPFPIGQGGLETTIQSGAWYAEAEVARGGSHDWATRGINESQPRLFELQTAVENAAVRALVGGG